MSTSNRKQPSVTVFGAGVAGLTVAHELVERGFAVQVVEPTPSLDIDGDCEVGGLARSQFSHVPRPDKANWRDFETDYQMRSAKPVVRVPQHIYLRQEAGDTSSPYEHDYYPKELKPAARVPNVVKLTQVAKALCDGAIIYAELGRHEHVERCDDCWQCPADDPDMRCGIYDSCERCRQCTTKPQCRGFNLEVEILGHCNADLETTHARVIGKQRAESVEEALKRLIEKCAHAQPVAGAARLWPENAPKPGDLIDLRPRSMGSYRPVADESTELGRALNSRVDFHILEVRLPGEHGYRFFPRFYRHLDDVMKRTPIYDAHGVETGRTVYDNLEALEQTAMAFADAEPQVAVLRRRPASLEEARVKFDEIRRALQATPEDLGLSMAKFMRYMTMCSERREQECEGISWWDFLEGPKYSAPMQRYLRATPQAMVAMSVTTSDARTNGNATVQLLLDQLTDGSQVDRTLNGPTSEAWLRHWKTYLRRQGVSFYLGKLTGIEARDIEGERRLFPLVEGIRECHGTDFTPLQQQNPTPPPGDPDHSPRGPHYYVLALPPTAAKEVLEHVDAEDLNDTFRTLKSYDFTDALGSMVGIQFYFRNNFKFFPGHTFFVDSAWRLTSISQLQFWREKRNVDSGYLGVLSVDIGNMYKRDTSQARMVAFESQWHAEQAQWHAEQTHYLDNEEEKKRAKLAAEAAKAAVAMRHLLPVTATDEQVEVLREIWQLPWLRCLLEFADAVPDEDEFPLPPGAVQPTDEELDSISALAAHQPQPIGDALAAGAAAIRSVPFDKRDLPLPKGPVAAAHRDDFFRGRDSADQTRGRISPGRLADHRDTQLRGQGAPGLIQMVQDGTLVVLEHVVHAGALAIAAAALAPGGKTAWKSTRREIARTTWRQIKLGLDYDVARTLPEPIFYWIDDTLVFDENDLPKTNNSPLLCELTGKFDGRPGPLPDTPGTLDSTYYEVCRKQWVLTGMIAKTHTRITTMELCCESGRHAANAVLHDIEHPGHTRSEDWIGTRIGDYCEIWNMEQYELEDLSPLKRVDARLLAEGLPHFMDILGIEPLIEHYLSREKNALPRDRMQALWNAVRGVGQADWGATGLAGPFWSQQREVLTRMYGPEAGRVLGELFEQGLRRMLNRGPGVDPVDPVEWFFRLFYPRHDESNPEALRKLFRDWADFVEKSLLKGGQS